MIRINQIKIPYQQQKQEYDILHRKIAKLLRINDGEIVDFEIVRRSIDAREKPDIYNVYSVDVQI